MMGMIFFLMLAGFAGLGRLMIGIGEALEAHIMRIERKISVSADSNKQNPPAADDAGQGKDSDP